MGTTALHLIDKARPDPVAGPGHFRELMTSVWYPARNVGRHPPAPWMSPAPMRGLLASGDFAEDAALAPVTAGHLGAPVRSTIGRLTVPLFELPMYPGDFARDIRFVLDRVEDLAAGRNPDVDHQPLPAGLGAALDLDRVGMFGWSKGATATALVMGADPRVRAGLSFDGPMESDPPDPPVPAELDRPFMLMTAVHTRAADSNVAEFWSHLTGWRLNVQAEGAVHSSYCDRQWLIPQLVTATGMGDEDLRGWIGTLDPVRAVRIQQAYPLAFFDQHLRGRRRHLLDGPDPAFPEVTFIP